MAFIEVYSRNSIISTGISGWASSFHAGVHQCTVFNFELSARGWFLFLFLFFFWCRMTSAAMTNLIFHRGSIHNKKTATCILLLFLCTLDGIEFQHFSIPITKLNSQTRWTNLRRAVEHNRQSGFVILWRAGHKGFPDTKGATNKKFCSKTFRRLRHFQFVKKKKKVNRQSGFDFCYCQFHGPWSSINQLFYLLCTIDVIKGASS